MPINPNERPFPTSEEMARLCMRIGKLDIDLGIEVSKVLRMIWDRAHAKPARQANTNWNLHLMQAGERRSVNREQVTAARQAAYRAGLENPGMRFSVRKTDNDCFHIIRVE